MLRGSLDAITTSGYVEGWAYDIETPYRPLLVSVQTGGQEIARGLAHRYRWDLIEAGCGTGWCAFSLAIDPVVNATRGPTGEKDMTLWDVAGERVILQSARPRTIDVAGPALLDLGAVATADPTVVTSIEQLRGCIALLAHFVRDRGAEAFVRAAYLYVLGRPADPVGSGHYAAALRHGRISAYHMLEALYQSEEFRVAPRLLAAPPEPGFIFSAA